MQEMTVSQLKEYGATLGLKFKAKALKADIAEAINVKLAEISAAQVAETEKAKGRQFMDASRPISATDREENYRIQGSTKLSPRQVKRLVKKSNHLIAHDKMVKQDRAR